MALNKMTDRSRFLDDLWYGWKGTKREFALFLSAINEIGDGVGITFTGEVGQSIDFLDVTVTLTKDGCFNTKLYVKPIDLMPQRICIDAVIMESIFLVASPTPSSEDQLFYVQTSKIGMRVFSISQKS